MESVKLFVLFASLAGFASAQFTLPSLTDAIPVTGQLLNLMIPKIMLSEYNNVPNEESYRFNFKTDDSSYREEVGIILNPGTDKEELVVMGAFSYTSGNIDTITMYTADKNGYKPRVQLKNRGVSPKLLKSLAHGITEDD